MRWGLVGSLGVLFGRPFPQARRWGGSASMDFRLVSKGPDLTMQRQIRTFIVLELPYLTCPARAFRIRMPSRPAVSSQIGTHIPTQGPLPAGQFPPRSSQCESAQPSHCTCCCQGRCSHWMRSACSFLQATDKPLPCSNLKWSIQVSPLVT